MQYISSRLETKVFKSKDQGKLQYRESKISLPYISFPSINNTYFIKYLVWADAKEILSKSSSHYHSYSFIL